MRIPARFAPIVFGALLSAIMVALVSAVVIATTRGINQEFAAQWLRSCATTWAVAFPTVTRRLCTLTTSPGRGPHGPKLHPATTSSTGRLGLGPVARVG